MKLVILATLAAGLFALAFSAGGLTGTHPAEATRNGDRETDSESAARVTLRYDDQGAGRLALVRFDGATAAKASFSTHFDLDAMLAFDGHEFSFYLDDDAEQDVQLLVGSGSLVIHLTCGSPLAAGSTFTGSGFTLTVTDANVLTGSACAGSGGGSGDSGGSGGSGDTGGDDGSGGGAHATGVASITFRYEDGGAGTPVRVHLDGHSDHWASFTPGGHDDSTSVSSGGQFTVHLDARHGDQLGLVIGGSAVLGVDVTCGTPIRPGLTLDGSGFMLTVVDALAGDGSPACGDVRGGPGACEGAGERACEVPEVPYVLLLPAMAMVAGGGMWLARRRRWFRRTRPSSG